jgi:hypothetical protein
MRGAVAVTAAELSSGRAMMRGHATAMHAPRHRHRARPAAQQRLSPSGEAAHETDLSDTCIGLSIL